MKHIKYTMSWDVVVVPPYSARDLSLVLISGASCDNVGFLQMLRFPPMLRRRAHLWFGGYAGCVGYWWSRRPGFDPGPLPPGALSHQLHPTYKVITCQRRLRVSMLYLYTKLN